MTMSYIFEDMACMCVGLYMGVLIKESKQYWIIQILPSFFMPLCVCVKGFFIIIISRTYAGLNGVRVETLLSSNSVACTVPPPYNTSKLDEKGLEGSSVLSLQSDGVLVLYPECPMRIYRLKSIMSNFGQLTFPHYVPPFGKSSLDHCKWMPLLDCLSFTFPIFCFDIISTFHLSFIHFNRN